MNTSKPRIVALVRQSLVTVRKITAGASSRLGVQSSTRRLSQAVATASTAQTQTSGANVEYLRRMYASTRDWYTAAETKAQLLLAINGAFITVLFGVLFGRTGDVRASTDRFGFDTWVFAGASVIALISAIICAALCLWSLHDKSSAEFTVLGVDPGAPTSYRAEVLWYFGHVARLQPVAVAEKLLEADRSFEVQALIYHVIDLAYRVLRKHKWVNRGWALTAFALIMLATAGISFFIHAQL